MLHPVPRPAEALDGAVDRGHTSLDDRRTRKAFLIPGIQKAGHLDQSPLQELDLLPSLRVAKGGWPWNGGLYQGGSRLWRRDGMKHHGEVLLVPRIRRIFWSGSTRAAFSKRLVPGKRPAPSASPQLGALTRPMRHETGELHAVDHVAPDPGCSEFRHYAKLSCIRSAA